VDKLTFGKRQEFVAIARLLLEGCDVYMTLVDDRGIDCVIRKNEKDYLDIQIKARSVHCKPENIASFPNLKNRQPSEELLLHFLQ
jgi:predicted helicase